MSTECKRKERQKDILIKDIEEGNQEGAEGLSLGVPSTTVQKPRESITHPGTTFSNQILWLIFAEHTSLQGVPTSSPRVNRENFANW